MKEVKVFIDDKRKPINEGIFISDKELNHSLAHLTLKIDPDTIREAHKITIKFYDVREEE